MQQTVYVGEAYASAIVARVPVVLGSTIVTAQRATPPLKPRMLHQLNVASAVCTN